MVIDNQARLDTTVWGDLLTSTAARKQLAGTVIDGICRDVDRALELNYPIFSRGNWTRTGKDRVRVKAIQAPVTLGGVRVQPDDWLRGDGDGQVVIPANSKHQQNPTSAGFVVSGGWKAQPAGLRIFPSICRAVGELAQHHPQR